MMADQGKTFGQLLRASLKSKDTEEWLDVHFTRPIGLFFALIWRKLGVHPNTITILSIFLGIGAAIMFYFTDIWHNLAGVALLMLANFCDSTIHLPRAAKLRRRLLPTDTPALPQGKRGQRTRYIRAATPHI